MATAALTGATPAGSSLRTLASLRWPYIPEPPSFHDPLSDADPKPLRLPQYEAIGKSSSPSSERFDVGLTLGAVHSSPLTPVP